MTTTPKGLQEHPSAASEPVHYVGFWVRFAAFLIDSTAASLLMAPLAAGIMGSLVLTDYDLTKQADLNSLVAELSRHMAFELLIMGSIFILFWIYKNATPGKMLFKAIIVDGATLTSPSKSQHIIRYFAYFISLVPFGLGFIWIGIDKRKQGWHDKIANTVVIKSRPQAAVVE